MVSLLRHARRDNKKVSRPSYACTIHVRVKHGMRRWSMHVYLMCVGSNAYLWGAHRPPPCVVPPPHLPTCRPFSFGKSWVRACLPTLCHILALHNLLQVECPGAEPASLPRATHPDLITCLQVECPGAEPGASAGSTPRPAPGSQPVADSSEHRVPRWARDPCLMGSRWA